MRLSYSDIKYGVLQDLKLFLLLKTPLFLINQSMIFDYLLKYEKKGTIVNTNGYCLGDSAKLMDILKFYANPLKKAFVSSNTLYSLLIPIFSYI